MKSKMFTGDTFRDVMERIEGVLEALKKDHNIFGVTIASQGGGLYAYVGAMFYEPKAADKKTAQVKFNEGCEVWIRAGYVCDLGSNYPLRHVVTLNGADRHHLSIHDVKVD